MNKSGVPTVLSRYLDGAQRTPDMAKKKTRHKYSLLDLATALFEDCPDHIAEDLRKAKDPEAFVIGVGHSYYDQQREWLKPTCLDPEADYAQERTPPPNPIFFDILPLW